MGSWVTLGELEAQSPLVWGLGIPGYVGTPGWYLSGAWGLTMPEDTGVLTLLDVGLGLQADGDTPAVGLIVKCDLQGYGGTGGDRVNLGRPGLPDLQEWWSLGPQTTPAAPWQAKGPYPPTQSLAGPHCRHPGHRGLTRTWKV